MIEFAAALCVALMAILVYNGVNVLPFSWGQVAVILLQRFEISGAGIYGKGLARTIYFWSVSAAGRRRQGRADGGASPCFSSLCNPKSRPWESCSGPARTGKT